MKFFSKRLKKGVSCVLALLLCTGALSGCSELLTLEGHTPNIGVNDFWADVLPNGFGQGDMSSTELAAYAQACTVTVVTDNGNGSGFFIDDKGTFATCYHVIDGANELSVKLNDGAVYSVKCIVDFDPLLDIAVLKANISDNDYLKLSDGDVIAGETVYAVGYSSLDLKTFSDGIVSTASRKVGIIDCVQTTATISAGNSGGPLINAQGEAIGINAYRFTQGEDINLAVSIQNLKTLDNDKNWPVSQYREWYDKETHRSYFVMSSSDGVYCRSNIHTYQYVTGQECLLSAETIDLNSAVEGYEEKCDAYFYPYKENEYDQYTEYLNSIGFEYQRQEDVNGGALRYYINEFSGHGVGIMVLYNYYKGVDVLALVLLGV